MLEADPKAEGAIEVCIAKAAGCRKPSDIYWNEFVPLEYSVIMSYLYRVCFIGGKAKRTEVCQPVGKQEMMQRKNDKVDSDAGDIAILDS